MFSNENPHFSLSFRFSCRCEFLTAKYLQKKRRFLIPYLVLMIVTVLSLILLVIFLYSIPHHDYYKSSRMKQILRENSLLIQNDLFLDKILYSFAVGECE